jgi:hypothetical protein
MHLLRSRSLDSKPGMYCLIANIAYYQKFRLYVDDSMEYRLFQPILANGTGKLPRDKVIDFAIVTS